MSLLFAARSSGLLPQAPELREWLLGDEFGDPVGFSAPPEPCAEVKSRSTREASLGCWKQGIDAAVQVRIWGIERRFPARNVGELPICVPAFVLDVMQTFVREIHR
jgi:hypothetical protein